MTSTARCAQATQGLLAEQNRYTNALKESAGRALVSHHRCPFYFDASSAYSVPRSLRDSVPQDQTSAEGDGNTVLLLEESDLVGPVDVAAKRVETLRAAPACPKLVNIIDAAPLEDLIQ
jgi:hypothetical protein